MALIRFNVDVAGTVARRLRQQRVEHADDGRVVSGLQQVFHGGQLLHHARQVSIALHLAHHCSGAAIAPALRGVGRADALGQLGRGVAVELARGMHAHHFAQGRQPLQGQRLFGFGACIVRARPVQAQGIAFLLQQQQVFAGEGVGQRVSHTGLFIGCQSWTRAGHWRVRDSSWWSVTRPCARAGRVLH